MVKSLSFHVVLKGDERVDKPFVSFSAILLISSAIQKNLNLTHGSLAAYSQLPFKYGLQRFAYENC